MSKNITKIKEDNLDDNEEEESDDKGEYIYQNQYINSNNILKGINEFETEHNGIRINLEKIEERAPEEEESCISSIVLSKEKKKYFLKNDKKLLLLKKIILKYKNPLYNFFQRWKTILNNNSTKKRFKKVLKKKKKITSNKYKIGNNIIKHEEMKEDEDKIKNSIISILNSNEKIKNFLKFFIEFGKSRTNLMKKYLFKWREFSHKNNKIKDKEQEYSEKRNKNSFNDNFNKENNNDALKRKEIKLNDNKLSKLINSRQSKENKKSFRIGKINNNINFKYNEPEKNNNNNINQKGKENDDEEEKEIIDSTPNKNKTEDNNNSEKKKNVVKIKKIKKVKKKKINKKKNILDLLKQLIEKINHKKIKRNYFNIWRKNIEINNEKSNDYVYFSIGKLRDLFPKMARIPLNNEFNEENNKLINQNENFFPIFPNNFSSKDYCNIKNNFLLGDNDNNIEEEKNLSRQRSLNFEDNPVEIKQRKYTFDDNPEVNEKTFRIIKLSKPVKEIKGQENGKGNFEVRVAEEFIEYGTEIIRYPSEITETITTTTRIIDDDNENEKKVYNSSEEELIFQDKKIIIKKDNKDDKKESEIDKSDKEEDNINNEYNNNLIKNNKIENTSNKKKIRRNIIIKENEVPKEVKKRNNDYINIPKEDIEDKINNNNKGIDYKMIEKILFEDNNIIINKESMTKEEEDEKIKSFKDFKLNNLQASNIKDINQLKNIQRKENIKDEKKNVDKKIKKLVKKYKKALHLLRKVIRSKRKRNKKNFVPEVKLKYYFDLWISKSFEKGKENSLQQKSENEKDKNIENNLKIKDKIIIIIDIIRKHRKMNKKLKKKLAGKDDFNKVYFCFNLWRNYIFGEDDDINGKEEEEICETYSSAKDNEYINEKNNEIKNINNDLYNTINKRYDNKFNNYKKTFKIKIPKYNPKIFAILKKFILLKEKNLKIFYFKKWHQYNAPLEKSYNTMHSKSKSALINPVKNPIYSKSESNIINKFKKKRNKIEVNKDLFQNFNNILNNKNIEESKNNEREEIIINTNINPINNNIKINSFKSDEKNDLNEEEENEEEKEKINDEKNSSNLSGINQNYFTKISDIGNHLKDKKEGNELSNKNNILINLLENMNNKNILFSYLIKWKNIISKNNKEIINEEIIKNSSPKKIMEKIKMQFSPFEENNILINNSNIGKKFCENGNILENSFMNIKRKNQKRIFIKNELSQNRKRANTFLIPQNENIISNDFNGNDLEEMSEQIKYNINPPHYNSFNSNYFNKRNSENKIKIRINNSYHQRREENGKIQEKEKIFNQKIFDLNQNNINLMSKNIYNNDLKNAYLKLLKQNYNIMAAYRIYYLYTIFNEENEFFKLRHNFNKWRRAK